MINWLKHNWAAVALLVVLLNWFKTSYLGISNKNLTLPMSGGGVTYDSVDTSSSLQTKMMPYREVAPSDSSSRVVIKDTSLSLQVKDVASEIKNIETVAKSYGGFLVNSYLSVPDSVASGNISVRVPEEKRLEAMTIFKKNAVKVVSESVSGNDVTDSYVDLQAQLEVLTKTKAKYQEILDKAFNVTDLMNVQQQLTNLQQQIDGIKGQQKYYEQSAKLSLINIYLSTDDLALPYAPTNEWRPAVIFKEAVRSLVGSIRGLGSLLIWLIVYIPIIIPVLGLIWFYKKRQKISK